MKSKKIMVLTACIFVFFSCSNKSIKKEEIKAKITGTIEKIPVTGESDIMGAIESGKIKDIKVLNKRYYSFEILPGSVNSQNDMVNVKLSLETKDNGKKIYDSFKIKLPKNVPVEALIFKEQDYVNMIKKKNPQLIKNIKGKEVAIFPIEEVADRYKEINKSYPNLVNLKDSDFSRIAEDFPEVPEILSKVRSYEEIIGIYQFISEVYKMEQVYLVNKSLSEKSDFRETAIYDFIEDKFGLTEAERAVIFAVEDLTIEPYKAQAVKEAAMIAKIESEKWAKEIGVGTGDTKADALRHTLWMYELSKIVTEQTGILNIVPYDKKEGTSFAEEFGAAREAKFFEKYEVLKNNSLANVNYEWLDKSNRMDLHNNTEGREYFSKNVAAGNYGIEWKPKGKYLKMPVLVFPKLTEPSLASVVSDLKNSIEKGVFINVEDETLKHDFYSLGVNKFGIDKYKGKIIYLSEK